MCSLTPFRVFIPLSALVLQHPEISVGWVSDILETTATLLGHWSFTCLDICPTLVFIYGTCGMHVHWKKTRFCARIKTAHGKDCTHKTAMFRLGHPSTLYTLHTELYTQYGMCCKLPLEHELVNNVYTYTVCSLSSFHRDQIIPQKLSSSWVDIPFNGMKHIH